MNTKQLAILIGLVVAVGLAGLVLYQRQQSSWEGGGAAAGRKLLGDLPVGENLAAVVVKQGTNELHLTKQNNQWVVRERGNYPANYADLSSTVLKLRDLKVVQNESVGASQLGRLELLPPGPGTNTATLVEFCDAAGKPLQSLLLGKKQMRKDNRPSPSPMGDMDGGGGGFPVGRWIMAGSARTSAALVSDALDSLEAKPERWLNKDFFKVQKIRAIAVTQAAATNSWKVSRTNETASDWQLADAQATETLDSSKTSGFGYALSSPSFNDVVVDPKPEALGLDKPVTIVIETFDGFTYTLKAGTKTGDNIPLTVTVTGSYPKERTPGKDEKAEDKDKLDKAFKENLKTLDEKLAQEKAFEKWTFLVQSYTLDALLKNRSELLPEKKADADATSTNAAPELATPPISIPGITPLPPQ